MDDASLSGLPCPPISICSGVSYLLATAYVFFGDVKHLYSVILTLWMYCSAIFYPVEQIQGFIRIVILNNPIYAYIHCFRKAVMYGQAPGGMEWVQMILWGIGMYLIGHWVLRKIKTKLCRGYKVNAMENWTKGRVARIRAIERQTLW